MRTHFLGPVVSTIERQKYTYKHMHTHVLYYPPCSLYGHKWGDPVEVLSSASRVEVVLLTKDRH